MASYRTCSRYYANTHSDQIWYWTKASKVVGLKTYRTLFLMTNFFFCHNAFQRRLLQRSQRVSVCEKGLIRNLESSFSIYRAKLHFFNLFKVQWCSQDVYTALIFNPYRSPPLENVWRQDISFCFNSFPHISNLQRTFKTCWQKYGNIL